MASTRQRRSDFETPGHRMAEGLSLEHRPDAISFDGRIAFSFGPAAEGDTSRGNVDRVWRVRATTPST